MAIKIIHKGETPEEIAKRDARFAREVAMLSRVQHKNLVKVVCFNIEAVFLCQNGKTCSYFSCFGCNRVLND